MMLWTVLPLIAERRARFPGHLVQQSSTFDTTRIRSSSRCRKFPPLDRTKPLTFVALRNRACMLNFVAKDPPNFFHFLSLIAYQLQLTKFSCFATVYSISLISLLTKDFFVSLLVSGPLYLGQIPWQLHIFAPK